MADYSIIPVGDSSQHFWKNYGESFNEKMRPVICEIFFSQFPIFSTFSQNIFLCNYKTQVDVFAQYIVHKPHGNYKPRKENTKYDFGKIEKGSFKDFLLSLSSTTFQNVKESYSLEYTFQIQTRLTNQPTQECEVYVRNRNREEFLIN